MAAKVTKKPKFPLPRGYFGDINLTKEQKEFYRECCHSQVQRGLLAEEAYVAGGKQVDPKKWKNVKSQHQLQLYRRRDGTVVDNDGKPSMIGVGRVEGSIEDALYGAYDQTDEELRMTAELVDVDFGDGIVLSNMEQGSETDPYRYLGIKWILTPFPMKGVMVDRDWILLESAGIKTDANGRRYGYHTLFTVELPQVPEFPEVIRGTMWYTFIFRDAGRGMIDVHSQGYMNNYGEIMDFITVIAGSQMLNGVIRYMKSAEAKKLTILALENLERRIATGLPPTTENSVPTKASCSVCSKGKSSNPFSSRRSMRNCRVCDCVVCLSCRVKKNILVGRQRVMSKVSVCPKCIVHAKTLIVNPADEKYVISREMQIGGRVHASSTASSVFDTVSSRPYTFPTRGNDETLELLAPSNLSVSGYSNASASGYNSDTSASGYASDAVEQQLEEKPSRASLLEAGGIVLHEESYQESLLQQAMLNSTRSAVSVSISESDDAASEQQMLFVKMMELQESAKRAHELTQASHEKMLETNAVATTSDEKGY